MNKLLGKTKKWGRCKVHGQGCEVCNEIRQPISRTTDYHISMEFEKKLLEDETYREQWIEDELQAARDYFKQQVEDV